MSVWRYRVVLALLMTGPVINYADRQIIAILKPLVGGDFHWTDAEYGHLASGFQFAAAMGLLFAGWVVDRVGIRRANPLAVGAWSVIAMAQAAARTLTQFATLRVALGAAEAMGTPVLVKSIAVLVSMRERSLAFGSMNAASTLGAIITPLGVPVLAGHFGWRIAFLVVGGAGLVWVGVWLMTVHGSTALQRTSEPAAHAPRVSWREALRDRRTWAIAGAKVLSDQAWWLLLFWAPDLLHRLYHLSIAETSVPLALMYGCAAVGAVVGGWAPRRFLAHGLSMNRVRKATLLACALLALPVAAVPLIHTLWMTVPVLGLTLAAHQAFSANLFALITDIVPVARVATVTGIGAFAGNLGGMGILALTGWMLTYGGTYGPVFTLAAVSYLLAVGWIQWLLPRLRSADAGTAAAGPGPAGVDLI